MTRIEKRIKRLAAALKSRLLKHVPGVRFHTPLRPEDSGGVVVFSAPGIDLQNALNMPPSPSLLLLGTDHEMCWNRRGWTDIPLNSGA